MSTEVLSLGQMRKPRLGRGFYFSINCSSMEEISRQLWWGWEVVWLE